MNNHQTRLWATIAVAIIGAAALVVQLGPRASAQAVDSVALPIEVIGPDGYIKEVTLFIDDPSGVDRLWLQVHRPGYNDSSRNAQRSAKASVRLNGGDWLDLTNETARVEEPAASYGGIGGGYFTLNLTIPASSVRAGANTIAFRFNGTDGITSGYRVLALNFLRGGQPVLPDSAFAEDDPAIWQPMRTGDDIALGKQLWESAELIDFPNGPEIKATCGSCHAYDGRDLKYFNYSDWSIVERSKFHGLSEPDAERIAAYIRSLDTPAPENARPWNPPYQPGPELDDKPAEEWAAGAGLEWVLSDDAEMLPFLFPNGTSEVELAKVIETDDTLNVREMPVALQLPDWNAWLPTIHPVDLWGDLFTANDAPQQAYDQSRAQIASGGNVVQALNNIYLSSFEFIGRGGKRGSNNNPYAWLALSGDVIDARQRGTVEEAKIGLASWGAIRQWELVQEFGLAEQTPQLLPNGEVRAWPTAFQSVFHLAPHMIGDNRNNFEFQSELVGDYLNNAWYQLQMTVNAGQRQQMIVDPVDWDYQLRHVYELGVRTNIWQPLRFVQTNAKMYQERDNGAGPVSSGWMLRTQHPRWLFGNERKNVALMQTLDRYEAGLWGKTVTAFLDEYLEVVDRPQFDLATWPRLAPNQVNQPGALFEAWYRLEPRDYVPNAESYEFGLYFPLNYLNHADSFYRIIPEFRAIGVEPGTLDRLIDWSAAAWPRGDWESLRAPVPPATPVPTNAPTSEPVATPTPAQPAATAMPAPTDAAPTAGPPTAMPPTAACSVDSEQWYVLRNVEQNRYLDTDPEWRVDVHPSATGAGKQFRFIADGEGLYWIDTRADGRGALMTSADGLLFWSTAERPEPIDARWQLEEASDGACYLRSAVEDRGYLFADASGNARYNRGATDEATTWLLEAQLNAQEAPPLETEDWQESGSSTSVWVPLIHGE